MRKNEIQSFVEALEVKALNGKQQSFSTAPLGTVRIVGDLTN